MTAWKQRADALVEQARTAVPFSDEYERIGDEALELINERLEAEQLRAKVWGTMTYACEECGHREVYELEVGVEGPPAWRRDTCYIACAFSAGQCERCRGLMTHTNFAGDVAYDEPRDPSVANVFRVPRTWPTYPTRGIADDGTVIVERSRSAFLSLDRAAVGLPR